MHSVSAAVVSDNDGKVTQIKFQCIKFRAFPEISDNFQRLIWNFPR